MTLLLSVVTFFNLLMDEIPRGLVTSVVPSWLLYTFSKSIYYKEPSFPSGNIFNEKKQNKTTLSGFWQFAAKLPLSITNIWSLGILNCFWNFFHKICVLLSGKFKDNQDFFNYFFIPILQVKIQVFYTTILCSCLGKPWRYILRFSFHFYSLKFQY